MRSIVTTSVTIKISPEEIGGKKFQKQLNKYHDWMNDQSLLEIDSKVLPGRFRVVLIEVECFPPCATIELRSYYP